MSIRPPCLQPGHTIGIIAPAGPVLETELQPAINIFQKRGYKVLPSPNLYKKQDYLAGPDDVRVSELHLMFEDKNVKMILCARGGYGTPRILEKIDYDLIRRNPKIFIGYSDITAVHFAIYKKTGLVTFHGPMARGIIEHGEQDLDNLLRVLSSEKPVEVNLEHGICFKDGRAQGRLFGGNLSLISSMVGTEFLPILDGEILFIEERGEPLYRIDRMLTHLRLSGLLKGLAGLVLGEFVECGDVSAINQLVMNATSGFEFPILTGLPVGHGVGNITIPLGLLSEIDTKKMMLSIPNPVSSS